MAWQRRNLSKLSHLASLCSWSPAEEPLRCFPSVQMIWRICHFSCLKSHTFHRHSCFFFNMCWWFSDWRGSKCKLCHSGFPGDRKTRSKHGATTDVHLLCHPRLKIKLDILKCIPNIFQSMLHSDSVISVVILCGKSRKCFFLLFKNGTRSHRTHTDVLWSEWPH